MKKSFPKTHALSLFIVVSFATLTAYTGEPVPIADDSDEPAVADGHRHDIPPMVRWSSHMFGLQADFGSSTQLGVGYLHGHLKDFGTHVPIIRLVGWGADVRGVIGDDVDGGAFIATAIGRAAIALPGLGLEAALGIGSEGDGLTGVGRLGAFSSLILIEVGYSYQFPINSTLHRPDWLGAHFLSLRGHIPFYNYGHEERDSDDQDSEWVSTSRRD
ncbi:MAG: hypothetical protein ACLFVJ_15980 [Persicimonas sp.]